MSSHFNYEIDEHTLRSRLREMSNPYKEDAWTQFETYSAANRPAHKSGGLPSFHLNINRTLVLPFVFGGVIILFSLLLFNFISIKNKTISEKPKTNPPAITKPVPVNEKPLPVTSEIKEEIKDTTPAVTVALTTPTIAETPTIAPAIENKTVPAATVAAISPATNSNAWTAVDAVKIYTSPNIASEVIGQSSRNQSYTALEETVYFVKVSFVKDNQPFTGFIRKDYLRKNGQPAAGVTTSQKRIKKVEPLESIHTPMMLSTGSEEEPELK